MNPVNLVIFASGSGTNAERISQHFANHPQIQVKEILSNKKDAYVHERAKAHGIPSSTFNRIEFTDPSFLKRLESIDYIILAGFLWLIPPYMVKVFKNKIINIHPALLPKFGGKGMFGNFVHEAVIASNESVSGITIHLVNEQYDEGKILFQAECEVEPGDDPATLARKIHQLEHVHYPKVIEGYILSK